MNEKSYNDSVKIGLMLPLSGNIIDRKIFVECFTNGLRTNKRKQFNYIYC